LSLDNLERTLEESMVQSGRPPKTPRADGPASGLLTTREASALLRVSTKQVYRLFARGLPHRRVGDEWRYDRDDLLAWAGGAPRPRRESSPPAIVASNGDVVVAMLLELASEESGALFGSALADRETALAALRRRVVLAAGYHGTEFPAEVPEGRVARLHLVRREVGIVAARGRAPDLRAAATGRVGSRPFTAGIRGVFDRALRDARISPSTVARGATEYRSHLEVASAVARGDADVGITTRAWAHALGLPFSALAEEDYGLLFLAGDLGEGAALRLCETAQGAALRRRLQSVPGYDTRECGRIHLDAVRVPAGRSGPRRE
jgi:putative molybdopterin biosynthesis protein